MLPSSSAFMLKSCWTSVTSLGVRPAWVSPANTSYSLPKPHVPIFLPAKSAADVMFLSLNETWSVGERWNTWAMSVIPAPPSRVCNAFGTHAIAKSAWPSASTFCGTMSTAPSRRVTSRFSAA